MRMESSERRFATGLAGSVLAFVTLAGAVAGLTNLFLGMRAVMEVGGACADGGPYVSAQPCPDGSAAAILGGIWGGIIFFGLYVWMCFRYHVPSFWPLGWSALFLSLGWNFLEYGLDPPGNGTRADAWGWLLCAVIFGLMGGVPLLLGGKLLWSSILPFGARPAPRPRTSMPNFRIVRRGHASYAEPAPEPGPAPDTDDRDTGIVGALERLAALRAAGALSDAEFAVAKQRLLGDDA